METLLSVTCRWQGGRDKSGMKKFYETAIIFIGTLGWWGFVYPELSAVTEACVEETDENSYAEEGCVQEIDEGIYVSGSCTRETDGSIYEDEKTGQADTAVDEAGKKDKSFFRKIGETLGNTGVKNGNVRIKSRIAEYLYQEKEKESGYE